MIINIEIVVIIVMIIIMMMMTNKKRTYHNDHANTADNSECSNRKNGKENTKFDAQRTFQVQSQQINSDDEH